MDEQETVSARSYCPDFNLMLLRAGMNPREAGLTFDLAGSLLIRVEESGLNPEQLESLAKFAVDNATSLSRARNVLDYLGYRGSESISIGGVAATEYARKHMSLLARNMLNSELSPKALRLMLHELPRYLPESREAELRLIEVLGDWGELRCRFENATHHHDPVAHKAASQVREAAFRRLVDIAVSEKNLEWLMDNAEADELRDLAASRFATLEVKEKDNLTLKRAYLLLSHRTDEPTRERILRHYRRLAAAEIRHCYRTHNPRPSYKTLHRYCSKDAQAQRIVEKLWDAHAQRKLLEARDVGEIRDVVSHARVDSTVQEEAIRSYIKRNPRFDAALSVVQCAKQKRRAFAILLAEISTKPEECEKAYGFSAPNPEVMEQFCKIWSERVRMVAHSPKSLEDHAEALRHAPTGMSDIEELNTRLEMHFREAIARAQCVQELEEVFKAARGEPVIHRLLTERFRELCS